MMMPHALRGFLALTVLVPLAAVLLSSFVAGVASRHDWPRNLYVLLPLGLCISIASVAGSLWLLHELKRRRVNLRQYKACRILVVMPKWLGDIVMATSFVKALRQFLGKRQSELVIDLLMRTGTGAIVRGERGFAYNDVIEFEHHSGLIRKFDESLMRLAQRIEKRHYDFVIHLSNTPRVCLATALARIPRRLGYGYRTTSLLLTDPIIPPPTDTWSSEPRVPRVSFYGDLVRFLGFRGKMPMPSVKVDRAAEHEAHSLLVSKGIGFADPYFVCVAPGASRARKRWPVERFVDLTLELTKAGYTLPFVFTFGPGEDSMREAVGHLLKKKGAPFLYVDYHEVDLSLLAALYKKAAVVVSNDNGAMHLARVAGTYTVAVLGPSNWSYSTYEAPGHCTFVYPTGDHACDGLGHRCETRDTTQCIRRVTVSIVKDHVMESIDRAILRRKINRIIHECSSGRMSLDTSVRMLGQKIVNCTPAMIAEIARLRGRNDIMSDEEKERLAYLYALTGDRDLARTQVSQITAPELRRRGLDAIGNDMDVGRLDAVLAETALSLAPISQ